MSRKIYIIIAVVFTVVLSVSTFFIIRNHIDSAKQNEVYDNLAEIVEDEPPKENEGVTFSEDKDYLAEYLELYRQNEDMVGWIKVEDTNINYPVVQSVNEPNFLMWIDIVNKRSYNFLYMTMLLHILLSPYIIYIIFYIICPQSDSK